ncbi:MAG: PLD nuclease N-terminal domain-containing protein [Acidimicrobiales bacterium]
MPYLGGGVLGMVIWVAAVLDCIGTDEHRCRNLPKGTWIMLVLFVPVVGGVAWLALGRPEGAPFFGFGGGSADRVPYRTAVRPGGDPGAFSYVSRTEYLDRRLDDWLESEAQRRRDEIIANGPTATQAVDLPLPGAEQAEPPGTTGARSVQPPEAGSSSAT